MTSNVIYKGNQRNLLTHHSSKSTIETDAPVDNNGKGERFSPTDLLATSLAACAMTIMGMKSEAMGLDIQGLTMEVTKIMYAEPRRVGEIEIKVVIPEHLQNLDKKSITILRNSAKTCPVAKSIHPDIKVTVDWGAWS